MPVIDSPSCGLKSHQLLSLSHTKARGRVVGGSAHQTREVLAFALWSSPFAIHKYPLVTAINFPLGASVKLVTTEYVAPSQHQVSINVLSIGFCPTANK